MRKPYLKTIATMVAMAFSFFVHANELINTKSYFEEASTSEMLVIVCPNSPVIAQTGNNCLADVTIPMPTSDDLSCPIISSHPDFSGMYPDTFFTITYTDVEDACGMMMNCTQMIIVVNGPPIIRAPNDTIVSCNSLALVPATNIMEFLAQGGSFDAACDLDSSSFMNLPDVLVSSTPCMKEYSRTYSIADFAGNVVPADQAIFTTDVSDPTIDTCPPNVSGTVSASICEAMISVDPLIASDDCGIQSITNDVTGTDDASGLYSEGSTTVTWTVTDSCGNTATCQTVVTVSDMTPPNASLNAASDTLFADCDASEITPYMTLAEFQANGSASDQCGTVTFAYGGEVSDGGVCPEFVTRSYIISDDASPPNDTVVLQVIRVEETIPPVFTPPAPVTLDCGADLSDVVLVGEISGYSDNCVGDPASVMYSDAQAAGSCPGNSVITRTYTVLDSCGNMAVGNQLITLQDMTPPTAICQDVTVYIGNNGQIFLQPEMINNGSFDNCTPTADLVLELVGSGFAGCNTIGLITQRMFRVGDGCGLFDTCMANVLALDTISPTIMCPPDQALSCSEDLPPPFSYTNMGSIMVNDNCDVDTFFLLNENIPTTFTCPYEITRTYQVTDESNNTAICVQTFTINDTQAPSLSQLADINILGSSPTCDTMLIIETPGFNDNCDTTGITITNSFNAGDNASGNYPLGTTEVSYYAEDLCGNIDTMTFNVIVSGGPMFTCPDNIDMACSLASIPPYSSYAAFEADGGSFVNTCNIDTSTFMLTAETNIQSNACDTIVQREYSIVGGSVTFTCSQDIRVRDTISPDITNSTPLIVGSVEMGICTRTIPSITISADDNCGMVTIENHLNGTSDAGGTFDFGTTEIYWTATDACGNVAFDTTEVRIGDNESPMLSLPMTSMAQCNIGEIDTIQSYAELLALGGSATDNCEIDTASFTFLRDTVTNFAGMTVPTRLYQISDVAGNPPAIFAVFLFVMDTEPPTITPLPDTILYTIKDTCIVQFTLPVPAHDDNCGVDTIFNNLGFAVDSLGTFQIDTTEVTWTVRDSAGNENTTTYNVIVQDTFAPMITNPDIQMAVCSPTEIDTFEMTTDVEPFNGMIMDACGVDSISFFNEIVGSQPNTVIRQYLVVDVNGNVDTLLQVIETQDNIDPVIGNCPATINLVSAPDSCGATVALDTTGMNISDNCMLDTVFNLYNAGGFDATAFYPVGPTTVRFVARDAAGNTDTCAVTINVSDSTNPIITCPDTLRVQCSIGEASPYTLSEFLADGGMLSDSCGIDPATFTSSTIETTMPASDTLCTRTYERTYNIDDLNGNSNSCTQVIMIQDTVAPVITQQTNTILYTTVDTCAVDFVLPIPIITEVCGLDTMFNNLNIANGVTFNFPIDTTDITWYALDHCGNIDSSSYRVIVQDTIAPIVMNPDTVIAQCSIGEIALYNSITDVEVLNGSVSDKCGLDRIEFDMTLAQIGPANLSVRNYNVYDVNGNVSQLQQFILIMDTIAPVFVNCPTDTLKVFSTAASCGMTVNLDTTGMNITDNCSLDMVSNSMFVTNGADASGFYDVGLTSVQFVATDGGGNTDTCTVFVLVSDTIAPAITCPDTIRLQCHSNVTQGYSFTEFIDAGGTISDACALDSMSFVVSEVETTAMGADSICMRSYERTYSIFDVNGNVDSCTQVILVQDTIVPIIDKTIADITLYSTEDTCIAFTMIPEPFASDNCDSVRVYNNLDIAVDSLASFPVGMTNITWYAQDPCGNIDSSLYDVVVLDTIAPIVIAPDTSFAQCNDTLEIPLLVTIADVEVLNGSILDKCGFDSIRFDTSTMQMGLPITAHRMYTAVDIYGNSSPFVHVVITMDSFPPAFTVPSDTIIACTEDYSDLAITGNVTMINDNCGAIDTMHRDTIIDMGPCDFIVDRIFTITDQMGNTSVDTQRITVVDTVAPVFTTAITTPMDIACTFNKADFPASQVLMMNDTCDTNPVFAVDTVFAVDLCNGYEVKYIYTGTDQCDNQVKDSTSFMVLPDTLAPVLTSTIDTLRLSTDSTTCTRIFTLTSPTAVDDCSAHTVTNSLNSNTNTFALDTTSFSWFLTDQCGNADTFEQVVIVIDSIAPVILCDVDETVNLNQDPVNLVSAGAFIDFKSDNCTNEYSLIMEAMRVDIDGNPSTGCGDIGNATFRDSVSFCCADIGQTTYLMVRVTDLRGNSSICNVSVEVKDNLAPSISSATALPPVRITCEYPLDLTDLSAFGKLVYNVNERDDIIVEGTNWGKDGYVIDNCPDNVVITETVDDSNLNLCNQGPLIRTFTLTDTVSNPPVSVTTSQVILIEDVSPIVLADITFPEDYVHYDCKNPVVSETIAGVPTIINQNKCSDIYINKTDLVFDQVFSGCPKVQRTWTVIDWCQYNTNNPNGPGKWVDIQFIQVVDTIAPVFVPQADVTICSVLDECDALVSLSADADDTCTDKNKLTYSYAVDTDGNGTYDQFGIGSTYTRRYDFGNYSIKWTVDDGCGNTSEQVVAFEVADCKPPQAVCRELSLSLGNTGIAELWPSDINRYSSDNCTSSEDLTLSFTSSAVVTGLTFTCDSVGPRTVALWVTDLAGNQSVCYTTVEIQDNHGICSSDRQADISGVILSRGDVPLSNTHLHLEGPEMEIETMTDSLGRYAFEALETHYDYMIQPSNNTNHAQGVSTLDLVLIQRHILNVDLLEDPLDLIAADVDNNERITGSDIVRLRKLILGITDEFKDNTSWRFIDVDHDFAEPDYPWPFAETWEMYNLGADYLETNFIGVKIGDVNGSVNDIIGQNIAENRTANRLSLTIDDIKFKTGDQLTIPVKANDWLNIVAAQWSIDIDENYLSFNGLDSDVLRTMDQSAAHFGDYINIAWFDIEGVTIGDDEAVIYLDFTAKRSGTLSNAIEITNSNTDRLAYNTANEKVEVDFIMNPLRDEAFELLQNSPNPFKASTEINFALAQKSNVRLDFYDNNGNKVHSHVEEYVAGTHFYTLEAKDIDPSVGVIVYALTVNGQSKTRKMIRLE